MDLGGGGGAFGLTELKAPMTKPSSRMNLNTMSPDARKNSVDPLQASPPQQPFSSMSGTGSPMGHTSMMVSFNFLTQVPIEEFVHQEHSKASKLSARLKSNASIKI